MKKPVLIVIAGPTASGKTALAIEVAKKYHTAIVSADSRQIFKKLDIGTAKPSKEDLKAVPHYLIDIVEPDQEYNAGKFEHDALIALDKIFGENQIAVLAGGSGMYINALCNGFDEVPQAEPEIRNKITALYKKEGIEYLRDTLKKLDPVHFEQVDRSNPHRMIRAIEVCTITGKPYSEYRKGKKVKRPFQILKIGLDVDRKELYKRIDSRVDSMMEAGLLDEVKGLIKYKDCQSMKTVGYTELIDHLEGNASLDKAVELIKQHSRNYAKRQMTWFRKDKDMKWFSFRNDKSIINWIESNK